MTEPINGPINGLTTGRGGYTLTPVGTVRSALTSLDDAPRQGREGAPEAWLEIDTSYDDALDGLTPGAEILVLTWLHRGSRDVLKVHPRSDPARPLTGVFATRSPDRPNPVGLHRVTIVKIDPDRGLLVHPLETLDGTPVIDIKPVLDASDR
ncbi:tRNA (N6-threonylcarbamoyladenosine(37)-N6)-methyltransferase TrmO [Microbispora sp. RL4-1S]|uniref:tRNA (N6-threonylcarbamoyladenosine(37)-N6)-methyltransferase TrmO n=1 Tax=Microbispora oryzae TaxID=2806554 RepID=A0A941APS5_9ACTN|nr:tRNA (N6-threonylcarbamoyladenosine(37)-N6)-methyltransferase TrmO [Microbispora oryzae]MBP2703994.1 tRNA (N6-threonylcarbamoyladenosine(37)-N6)-methyltransferase TrmO [Microbispora oryzae]